MEHASLLLLTDRFEPVAERVYHRCNNGRHKISHLLERGLLLTLQEIRLAGAILAKD